MFSLLKRFRKQEEMTVGLSELSSWFDQQAQLVKAPLQARLEGLRQRFSSEKDKIREHIAKLKKAELKNPKVTDKERHFMEGNRSAYIAKVELLCSTIRFPNSLAEVEDSHMDFSQKLELFAKSSAKPYYILQEFLANESRDIALSVKSIEKAFTEAKKLEEELAGCGLDELRNQINALNSLIDNKAGMSEKRKALEAGVAKEQQKLGLLQDEREKIVKGREYAALQRQQERLKQAKARLKQKEDEMLHEFAVLNHALKKYVKIAYEHEELAGSYAERPLQTLISDLNLEIVAVLQKIKDAVERGSIELKDRRREKTLSVVDRMTREYLGQFLTTYNQLSVERRDLEAAVEHSEVARKLRDADMRLRHSQNAITSKKSELDEIQQRLQETKVEAKASALQDSLKELVNRQVSIDISGNSAQEQ
jgi:hypothetical protein